ncbi:Universal stress protein family [Lactococcus lactis subsp. lactis]|nr:Universal stress protein family [Lactococcus lactis subsp. lactis]
MLSFIGAPKKNIIKFAEDCAMDLIVIGRNSKKLLVDCILIGSTTFLCC